MDDGPVEAIRDRRAGWAAGGVIGPEHEVVDEELRAPLEEVRQRGAPLVGLESIRLVDPHPRQFLPPPRQLVAAPRELLLLLEQLKPRGEPFFTCSGYVLRHRSSHLRVVTLAASARPLELRTAALCCACSSLLQGIQPYEPLVRIRGPSILIQFPLSLWLLFGLVQNLVLVDSAIMKG